MTSLRSSTAQGLPQKCPPMSPSSSFIGGKRLQPRGVSRAPKVRRHGHPPERPQWDALTKAAHDKPNQVRADEDENCPMPRWILECRVCCSRDECDLDCKLSIL